MNRRVYRFEYFYPEDNFKSSVIRSDLYPHMTAAMEYMMNLSPNANFVPEFFDEELAVFYGSNSGFEVFCIIQWIN